MRTSARILRTIGLGLTWSGWEYAAPRHYGPWAYLGTPYYYLYRLPSPPTKSARPAGPATPRSRQGGG
jgi:hypothetical protein